MLACATLPELDPGTAPTHSPYTIALRRAGDVPLKQIQVLESPAQQGQADTEEEDGGGGGDGDEAGCIVS